MTGEATMDHEGCCATIIVRDGEVIGEGWNNVPRPATPSAT